MPLVDLASLKKYYPLQLGNKTLHWLDTSLLKGQAQNTVIKLKGKFKIFLLWMKKINLTLIKAYLQLSQS